MTREQILKKGGFANTPEGIKAFYKKYNTPEKFFAEHGGSLSGAPHDGQPTADQFFNYGAPALGHMNIPMSNPTYLAHGGMYHSDGPFYHAEPGMIIPPKATPVAAPDVDAFMTEYDKTRPAVSGFNDPPKNIINTPKFNTRSEFDDVKAGNIDFAKYSDADMEGLGFDVPAKPKANPNQKPQRPYTPAGQDSSGVGLFTNAQGQKFTFSKGEYNPYSPSPTPPPIVAKRYGGYMDMGGYNSPTNYGSFSVPMDEGGMPMAQPGVQVNPNYTYTPLSKADSINVVRQLEKREFQPDYKYEVSKNKKKVIQTSPSGEKNEYNGWQSNKNKHNAIKEAIARQDLAAGNVPSQPPVFFNTYNQYRGIVKEEYGGILDASNNQDYPMMDEGGMESMSKGNIIKMLKQAARQRKKAYREGGNTSMQGGNANNIPQQITDNFINGVSNLYNNYMIDQKTEYVANQINAMDQEMMPMANMGMQSYDMSPQIGQYQNYISNLENQNQSAFGNMLNSATNLAATLPRGSQNPFAGAPTVSDITKAQAGINKMPKFALTDKSQEVNKGIQDINRARAEEEQRKSYANQTDDVKHLTNEDIKRLQAEQERSYQNWNNTYNSGSQNPNKPWWEQPYRFGFNDPRGFAGMFPDTYYKTSTEGSRTLKEAKDRKLPFTSMEPTYGAGAKAAANISKLFGKDPNETLTMFSPKKIRYYFGQGTGQGTKQPATADTPAATNSLYNPMTAEQAANPYGQIPEGTTQAPAPYLPASVAPGYDASGRLLNPPQSLPGTNLFNMNAQLKEYTGKPLNERIKQSRVEELMNPFSADAQRQLDIMRDPYTGKAPGVFYNQADQPPYGFEQDAMSNQSPMRKAYGGDYFGQYYNGGIPMAQWGFANPVDMTMLGISNTKPELYVDAKRKRDYSAAAPFASGFISNVAQGVNISKNQKAIEQAKNEFYDPAGKFAQATTGNRGVEEINTQAFMPDKSMDSPYQTSAYSVRGEYGGSFDEGGAYEEGKEYDVTDEQIEALENAGYILKY